MREWTYISTTLDLGTLIELGICIVLPVCFMLEDISCEWRRSSVYQYVFHELTFLLIYILYFTRVLYRHVVARPQFADVGYGLQIWRMVVNMFTKQSWTEDEGRSSSSRVGRGTTNPST
jgi:hypothetical protein